MPQVHGVRVAAATAAFTGRRASSCDGGGAIIAHALAALPDNEHALSGSADETVKLFNVNDGAVLRAFKRDKLLMDLALCSPTASSSALRLRRSGETAYVVEHGLAP